MSPSVPTLEKRILVIDDDPEILDVVQQILTLSDYHVQISLTGAPLQRLESEPPDLILLDVLLEGKMDGSCARH